MVNPKLIKEVVINKGTYDIILPTGTDIYIMSVEENKIKAYCILVNEEKNKKLDLEFFVDKEDVDQINDYFGSEDMCRHICTMANMSELNCYVGDKLLKTYKHNSTGK